jgi:GAF domain-containing protein
VAHDQDAVEDVRRFSVDAGGPDARNGGAVDLADTLGPLAGEFVRLAETLMDDTTVLGVLQRVVHAGKAVVPGADLVSVTIRADTGSFDTPVQTDVLATELDELQYRFGEGPCVAATLTEGLGVTFDRDVRAGRQYPRWGPAAAELGVRSVLAVGLFPRGGAPRMGALNAYSHRPGGLDEQDRDLLLVLAAHASTALAATQATTASELEVAHLREALRSRDVIGQAKGILMERRGVSADEAFDILRRASQSLNIKLTQVAEKLVEHRGRL